VKKHQQEDQQEVILNNCGVKNKEMSSKIEKQMAEIEAKKKEIDSLKKKIQTCSDGQTGLNKEMNRLKLEQSMSLFDPTADIDEIVETLILVESEYLESKDEKLITFIKDKVNILTNNYQKKKNEIIENLKKKKVGDKRVIAIDKLISRFEHKKPNSHLLFDISPPTEEDKLFGDYWNAITAKKVDRTKIRDAEKALFNRVTEAEFNKRVEDMSPDKSNKKLKSMIESAREQLKLHEERGDYQSIGSADGDEYDEDRFGSFQQAADPLSGEDEEDNDEEETLIRNYRPFSGHRRSYSDSDIPDTNSDLARRFEATFRVDPKSGRFTSRNPGRRPVRERYIDTAYNDRRSPSVLPSVRGAPNQFAEWRPFDI